MGVPQLWKTLRPAGELRALSNLAIQDGFVANSHGDRALRNIGIDASIWFFHAQGAASIRKGENPELRMIFFRCARLLRMPLLPIFVFDGPKRPKIKRGKRVCGKEHWLVNNLRIMLHAFGFECRTAPGEAEAELSFLNHVGIIDAILSDDVDCFLFGAHTVIRNTSITLSGNCANPTNSSDDSEHAYIYRTQNISSHPAVGLTRGGMILIALLCGGDYHNGIVGCGIGTARALAQAGFGDTLVAAAYSGPTALADLLPSWRTNLCHELQTNASGHAMRRNPRVAQHDAMRERT